VKVLDASAFIHDYDPDGDTASIPAVRDELTDAAAYRYDALAGGGMRVRTPGEDALAAARDAARATGDLGALSDTDLRLLAAAYELDGTVVTDDYAVQNAAAELGVAVDVIEQSGISERRDWQFQCRGCGREFEESEERCPVCGSDLTRKNPR